MNIDESIFQAVNIITGNMNKLLELDIIFFTLLGFSIIVIFFAVASERGYINALIVTLALLGGIGLLTGLFILLKKLFKKYEEKLSDAIEMLFTGLGVMVLVVIAIVGIGGICWVLWQILKAVIGFIKYYGQFA
jgi:hypothetical protein